MAQVQQFHIENAPNKLIYAALLFSQGNDDGSKVDEVLETMRYKDTHLDYWLNSMSQMDASFVPQVTGKNVDLIRVK